MDATDQRLRSPGDLPSSLGNQARHGFMEDFLEVFAPGDRESRIDRPREPAHRIQDGAVAGRNLSEVADDLEKKTACEVLGEIEAAIGTSTGEQLVDYAAKQRRLVG